MVIENEVLPYFQWLVPGPGGIGFLVGFSLLMLLLIAAGFLFGLIVSAVRHGPSEGLNVAARVMFDAVREDLPKFSFRRMYAIAMLAVQEAIRRRVLIVFAVFVLLLLFAGLFLDVKNDNPARTYLSFVHFSTNLLVLLLGLFLSTFSLPNDIKTKTIYTVVTKPVRSSEIVLGRIIGFTVVGTAMLAVMALGSYIFVVRGLNHTHTLVAEEFTDIPPTVSGGKSPGRQARTSFDAYHSHKVTISSSGKPVVAQQMGHWHPVTVTGEGSAAKFEVGPPQGMLEARVPVYGKLQFFDRNGNKTDRGINTGDEWEYRGYIEGGSASEAVWTFEGVTRDRFPNGLPIEMNFHVFRTYKGNIERGVLGELIIRNPSPTARIRASAPIPFESKEFVTDSRLIPTKLKPSVRGAAAADAKAEIDLFDDLTDDGRMEIVLRCAEPAQYFGAAQADLYIRAADRPFFVNFAKGYLGIWLQMLMMICFGVMFSTFLSGPVAMMAALSALILGFFGQFIRDVAGGTIEGGGPLESLIRILTQVNMQVDLEGNAIAINIVKGIDFVMMQIMTGLTYLLPNYGLFSTSNYIAYGFDINFDLIAQHLTLGLAYFIVISTIGYFCLKTREIAA